MAALQDSLTIAVCKVLIGVSVAAMLIATAGPGVRQAPGEAAQITTTAQLAAPTVVAGTRPDDTKGADAATAALIVPDTAVMPDGGAYFSIDDEADISPSVLRAFNPPPASPELRFETHYARLTSMYADDPEDDIEALWGLAFDLDRRSDAVRALAPLQGHPVGRVRELAGKALASLSAADSTGVAGNPPDWYAPEAAANFQSLYDRAVSGTDPFERREALGELGTLAQPESVFALEDVLYQASDPALQREALEALGNIARMQVEADRIQRVFDNVAVTSSEEIAALAAGVRASLADPATH